MLTAIETVWEQIKLAAHDYARQGTRLDMRGAETLVVKFFREERVTPWPSADVIEFYATELLTLIDRERYTTR